jgi:hypothetical protein
VSLNGHLNEMSIFVLSKINDSLMKLAISFKHPLDEREKSFETHSVSLKTFQ